jgi:hypothetical protein
VLRPDAIALVRRGDVGTLLIIERDLGSERHETLIDKLHRYERTGIHPAGTNLGFVVESARRAGALRVSLRRALTRGAHSPAESGMPCWVTVGNELLTDPFGASWRSPDGRDTSVLTMPCIELRERMPLLSVPALLDDAAEGAFDDRALAISGWRGR